MARIIDRDKLTQIFSMGVGKSGLSDELDIIKQSMKKQYAIKSLDGITCPECKCIVFDATCPNFQTNIYCWNCGQLVSRIYRS